MAIQPNANGEYIKTLTVKTTTLDVNDITSLSEFVKAVKPYSKTTNNKLVISRTIDRANNEGFSIRKSTSNADNVKRIKEAVAVTPTIPEATAYIYDNINDVNTAIDTLTPPTLLDVFNGWDRIRNNEYYPKGQGIPEGNEAEAWYWDDNLETMVMPLNTTGHMGFISDYPYEDFSFELTVTSPNSDDDSNGVIMAFDRNANVNELLIVMICCDHSNNANEPYASNIRILLRGSVQRTYAVNDNNNVAGGWRGKTKRINVRRNGDNFTVRLSKWNENTYDDDLTITLNLNDHPDLAKFKGPKKYGFYNHSQARSSYHDIRFTSNRLSDIIVDGQNNKVYKYRSGIGWELLPGVIAQDIFGIRILRNEDTNERYELLENGNIVKL